MNLISVILFVLLVIVAVPVGYLLVLAVASAFPSRATEVSRRPTHRFIIAIPAHNEASVIAATVSRLGALDFPSDLYQVHVVADHCSDGTAALARESGAIAHERDDGPRTGKGAALSWLFARVLSDHTCDALVIFDGDTRVAPDFLRLMDVRLAAGARVIQGQHVISNPGRGWFPALTWAMFLVDNRFSNLGRTKLGLSAKNMGDSICFRADVLRQIGWGEGLTEDYQLRQRLLLEGIKIAYEPAAIGRGEGAVSWDQAQAQRARWLRGTRDASEQFGRRLLRLGVQRRDPALLDGALQAYFPSYSTLSVIAAFFLVAQLLANEVGATITPSVILGWAAVTATLFVYPLLGLVLERAPLKAYPIILSGPVYIVWRTWLAVRSRQPGRVVAWVRTDHGEAAARR